MITLSDTLLSRYAPLLPVDTTGIVAHQAPDFFALWEAMEQAAESLCDVPFWAVVWPGARLLSRYLLEHPTAVSGKTVLDFGAGGAVAAIAALRAGARQVTANDIDPTACRMAAANGAANAVPLLIDERNLLVTPDTPRFDLILLADMFYRKPDNTPLERFLHRQRNQGAEVLIADGNRPFTPKKGVEPLCTGRIPVDRAIEGCDQREVTLFRMVD